mgnify:FL=1
MFKCQISALKYGKRLAILILTAALLLGTFACTGPGPLQTGVIEDEEELQIDGEIMFTISNESGTASEAAAPNAIANAFMRKYPNVKIIIDDANRTTYATRISTGEIGDVFWCDANDAHNYKKNHNALMMLDYYRDRLGIDTQNIFSGALTSGMIDGRLYMVPRNIGQQVLIYNKDALRAANIEIPSDGTAISWEEFKDICRRLTLDENGTYTQVGASFKIWWSPVWQAFAEGYGGTWIDTVQKKVSFVSDENVMKGINEIVDACNEGWLRGDNINYTGQKGQSYSKLTDLDYVFRTFGDMQWITAYGNSYDNADIDWDFCSFPAFPTHKVGAGATGYVVYNRTRNVDTAAAFALFFLTEEGQQAYHSATGGNVPLLKSQASADFWRFQGTQWEDKNFDAFVSYPEANIPASVIVRAPSEISEILSNDNLISAFGSIINGQKDVQTVFSDLETRCNETWSKLTV